MLSPKSRTPARDRPTSDQMQFGIRQVTSPLINSQTMEYQREGSQELSVLENVTPTYRYPVIETSTSNFVQPICPKVSSRSCKSTSSPLQHKKKRLGLLSNVSVKPYSQADLSVMATADKIYELIHKTPDTNFLLLDIRVFPQYSHSRIKGALNLCIPTTLLKRPSFNLQKLNDTFTNEAEKIKFSQWPTAEYIIVYDAFSTEKKDASLALNTLQKFAAEGWKGTSYLLQGGFKEFSKNYPSLVDNSSCREIQSSKINLSLGPALSAVAPVAGGCAMPTAKNEVNPFFSNIRQNQDLIGGVGQMDIKLPSQITNEVMKSFPRWLQGISDKEDHGKIVSHKYLRLEQDELATMSNALSSKVSYETASADSKSIRLAGIEKGSKNRYNNIWPYEHSRVKLLSRPADGCDYVNASHIKSSRSNKRYIASQGPLPATFEDFWSVVWDQDVRLIVMLTAESEGGRLKCHNYWSAPNYGQFTLKLLSENSVPLESSPKSEWGRRRATTIMGASSLLSQKSVQPDTEVPQATVRKFAFSNTADKSSTTREITQIQYSSWPDFGAPASPSHLLGLIELCDLTQRTQSVTQGSIAESEDTRPMLVHCSAGCGRTGTFCTIDSVIDVLKRQRKEAGINSTHKASNFMLTNGHHIMNSTIDTPTADSGWGIGGDVDLIEKTVEDFRSQRISMVQNLQQFVLCYETVLEWIARQVIRGQKPTLPPVHRTVSSVAFGFSGSRDRCGSVF